MSHYFSHTASLHSGIRKMSYAAWRILAAGLLYSVLCSALTARAAPPDNAAIVAGAKAQIGKTLYYDGSYQKIDYPNGDVPLERGVCSDVVIRALRHSGEDLQQKIHLDMRANFSRYPALWGLKAPDRNIDHRRVPNIRAYLTRHHRSLPITQRAQDYLPGDIVTWRLPNNLPHIGIVSDEKSLFGVPLIVHNIARGARQEDGLFTWTITGHYRYFTR